MNLSARLLEPVMDQGQVSGAPEHEAGEGDEVEAGQRLGQALVGAGEQAAAGHPGEGTLDAPLYNVASACWGRPRLRPSRVAGCERRSRSAHGRPRSDGPSAG